MNYLMEEQLAAEHRRDILRDIEKIRLQEQALQSRVFRANLFTRTMEKFGAWLVRTGQSLEKRYQSPAPKPCNQNHSYAQ